MAGSFFSFLIFWIRKSAFLIPKRTSKNGKWRGREGERAKGERGSAVRDSALSSVAWSRHTRALIINELMVD